MKNFILPVLALLFAVPFALASNMKMVTYFPVPYAAYNDVSVTGTLDLGIINTCGLDCGNKLEVLKSNTSRPLDTGRFIVRNGTLNLDSTKSDSQVKGLSFQAGNGNATSKAVFEFKHDLHVNALPLMQTAEATNAAYLSSLKLFPSKITSGNLFPKCEVSEISWKKLKVGDTEEAFLVCGTGVETKIECSGSASQPCGCENKGTQTRECNFDTGEWSAWGACSIEGCSCSDAAYKLANKSVCCPSAPKTDTDCWKWTITSERGSEGDRGASGNGCGNYWDSTGENISSCETTDPSQCREDGVSVCTDTLENGYYSVGDTCAVEDWRWTCNLIKNGW